jgi:hypothetical protein
MLHSLFILCTVYAIHHHNGHQYYNLLASWSHANGCLEILLRSLVHGQEIGRKWQMHARLKPFSIDKFALRGYDSWVCGEFLHLAPKSVLLLNCWAIDVIVGSAGNIYAHFLTKFGPRMFGETDIGPPVLLNVQTWSRGYRGFEITSQIITSQSSTVVIFKKKNELLYVT